MHAYTYTRTTHTTHTHIYTNNFNTVVWETKHTHARTNTRYVCVCWWAVDGCVCVLVLVLFIYLSCVCMYVRVWSDSAVIVCVCLTDRQTQQTVCVRACFFFIHCLSVNIKRSLFIYMLLISHVRCCLAVLTVRYARLCRTLPVTVLTNWKRAKHEREKARTRMVVLGMYSLKQSLCESLCCVHEASYSTNATQRIWS